ncbi:hypothetical protein LLG96_04375 [bacterium]|nr:hypothetical protein [bacterium]
MKRRDAISLVPLSAAGMLGLSIPDASAVEDSKPLSLRYFDRVKEMLEHIRSTESDNLLEAAYHIAGTYKKGGKCYSLWDLGHSTMEDIFENRPGNPDIFTSGYPADKAQNGDLLLANVFGQPFEDPRARGVFVIGGPAPWCGETPDAHLLSDFHQKLRIRPYSDLWIDTHISTLGAIMWLPGAKYPMGAVSGVLGMTTFWMMIADAVRILAADDVYVNVMGDEPDLDDKARYTSLNEPLGERYFDEMISQINRIEAELGSVEKIADTAVSTILSGGKVYIYSRLWETLAVESNTRRGGLTMFKSVFTKGPEWGLTKNFKGTDKDFVIMGIYQPDDEADLAFLDTLRKLKIRTASIGPATRNGVFADGKNVPSRADVHLGLMCDTYGIFAVPGVKRKVCPTSGVLVNQMFYAVCMRMAELIIERTGNTPYIYPNAAIEGPPYAEFGRIHNAGQRRGY